MVNVQDLHKKIDDLLQAAERATGKVARGKIDIRSFSKVTETVLALEPLLKELPELEDFQEARKNILATKQYLQRMGKAYEGLKQGLGRVDFHVKTIQEYSKLMLHEITSAAHLFDSEPWFDPQKVLSSREMTIDLLTQQGFYQKLKKKDVHHAQQKLLVNGLPGFDFSNIHAEGIDFSQVNLQGANFSEAHLVGADFSGANLTGANFRNADLGRAQLQYGTIFKGANLDGANLSYANLKYSLLEGASLCHTNLYHANLEGTSFQGAKLIDPNLAKTRITPGTSFSSAMMKRVNFAGLHLLGVDFSQAKLYYCSFRKEQEARTNLEMSNFQQAVLYFTDFDFASLNNANFSGAQLVSVRFDHAELGKSTFARASFLGKKEYVHNSFTNSILHEADFSASVFASQTTFQGAGLRRAIFKNSLLEQADFAHADIFHADFSRSVRPNWQNFKSAKNRHHAITQEI
ncbi:MAG TPA: pentapeptide repeat-containing protein [Candidatus Nanoarchaeia archaeon]|nr:pentapeptide repeat-containing protein [Candidatus Nanoarchaeia archaeon]